MILNTFLFIILLLILIFVVFALVSPFTTTFFALHERVQTSVEEAIFQNITNGTQEMIKTYDTVKTLIPWLPIIGFILGVLIYVVLTEVTK